MEQEIRFCTTSDGVRVAYSIIGDGPPLIMIPGWTSHQEISWQGKRARPVLEGYGPYFKIVSFDKRGTGLSDRGMADYSIDARLRDLDAVVEAVGAPQVALYGMSEGGPLAMAYSAKHPEQVSALVLLGSFARGQRVDADEKLRATIDALVRLVRAEWALGSRTLSNIFQPGASADELAWWVKLQEASATAEDAAAMLEANVDVDVSHLLPEIQVPTLVVHVRGDVVVPFERGREVASSIPGARFVAIEGERHNVGDEEVAQIQEAVVDFLLEHHGKGKRRRPQTRTVSSPSGMTAILFLDIADSTALTTQLGDAAYRERERALDAALRAAIADAGGSAVEGKVLGDGIMAVFSSARQAIDAARRCCDLGGEAGLPLHLGLHAGDVEREGSNVHGGAVQVAARVQSEAAAGEILVSQTVRDLARTSAGVAFEDRGERALKGIAEPVRLFAVKVEG